MCLRDAGCDGTNPDLRHQFYRHRGIGIGVLEIKNQLRQVLDRIDVMMRWRRNQLHARGGIAELGDILVDLVARQLAAFARLGALRHLDLQLPRVDEIVGRDTETRRGDLLDVTVLRISVRKWLEPLRIFATFAGVALSAETVHRDRQCLVRFFADRPERHGSRVESFDDFARRLDPLDGNGRWQEFEIQQTAQIRTAFALVVHQLGEFGIGFRVVRLTGVLQLINGVRVPVVVFTLDAVMNLASKIELSDGRRLIRHPVAPQCFFSDLTDPDTFDARGRAGEVAVDDVVVQSDGLEDLGTTVRLDGGDAHLREDLEQPLVDSLDELAFRRLRIQPFRQIVVTFHVYERFEHEIGIDRPGTIADQPGELVHIARLAGLKEQPDFGPRAFADQMMMDRGNPEQTRNRRPLFVDA